MTRAAHIFIGLTALSLAGCAAHPLQIAGAVCTDRESPEGPVRVCETATQVTVAQTVSEPPIVARDPEPDESRNRILGLAQGEAADRIIAQSGLKVAGSCTIDRRALKEMLARRIARRLLADL